jgi:hypothetical protein
MGANTKILSCRPCRERKVRCDRLTPCKSCVRHGCENSCQPHQPTRSHQDKLPIPRANESVRRAQSTGTDTRTPTTTQVLTPARIDDSATCGVAPTKGISLATRSATALFVLLLSQSKHCVLTRTCGASKKGPKHRLLRRPSLGLVSHCPPPRRPIGSSTL